MRRPAVRLFAAVFLVFCLSSVVSCNGSAPAEDLRTVDDFALTERSGRTVRRDDLKGKVWIASFVFTCCTEACPHISGNMARLQQELAGHKDVVLVSFSVDPKHDTPEQLQTYAAHYQADPDRWLFLTGEQEAIHRLIRESFQLIVGANTSPDRTPGNRVLHSNRLVLVDRQGRIRGRFKGAVEPNMGNQKEALAEVEADLARLRQQVAVLVSPLPRVNAILNGTSAFLLLVGFAMIRWRQVTIHKMCMLAALAVSTVFLGSYLYYHLVVCQGEPTRFTGEGWVRTAYFAVLLSHTLLAVVAAPLALFTAYQGLRGRLARHVKVARWTLPIWLYVSLTGVVVYWMLYHLYPSS